MNPEDKTAKERIMEAVRNILAEGESLEKVTVREIAKRANVGIGTLNYHYESKDKLVYEAVGNVLEKMAAGLSTGAADPALSPFERLRRFLIEVAEIVMRYQNHEIFRHQLKLELEHGSMNTPLYLVPLLNEIFGGRKSESELKMLSLQIVIPLQVIFLKLEPFTLYTGFDISCKSDREQAIDILLNNVIKAEGRD